MDPFTHGLLGGSLAAAFSPPEKIRPAAAVGFVAALLADLDTFIQSASDPLLQLEFHRQFTHSLIFTPVGALVAVVLLWPWARRRLTLKQGYGAAFLGYLTAGPLDGCTSYGTQLLWPFSDLRIAWSIIPVVEPVTTLLLAMFLLLAVGRQQQHHARQGLFALLLWFTMATWQHQRAATLALAWAETQGDQVETLHIKPTMGNLILWRGVYKSAGLIKSVAVRPGWWGEDRHYPGATAPWFDPRAGVAGVAPESLLGQDVVRFARLSGDFVVRHPKRPLMLGDGRYALLPHHIAPLWGIIVNPEQSHRHAPFDSEHPWEATTAATFLHMLQGRAGMPDG